ncbi:glycerate kinase [Microbacterium radiodurans]|uniref:Glycerate kinase n=1 Tax=Microbacterium radiodurans TaxID=661398 RepID=A0A5J5IUH8_9MICO|nr:glycerate kinase [Microbacterium radiodurans]KAA9089643.1 glycerate kinase [Microbacterium radiodurans]
MSRRIVVAIDSLKGSISAADAAAALAAGWTEAAPADTIDLRPMADGGEGTVDAFAAAVPGSQRMPVTVTGPDGAEVAASWLLLPPTRDAPAGTAVIELASTSGIELLGDRRHGLDADTTGFGQAIAAALDAGVSRLVLGIGSSASTDGGVGMLRALGARVTDGAGVDIAPGARGLSEVVSVDLSGVRPLPDGGAVVLSDVSNPLLGAAGAAAVFGPQKGLDKAGVERADAGLARLVRAASEAGLAARAAAESAGAGAAGGTGFGLLLWGARLTPGAPEVAALIGLADAIAGADAVVTGEGSFDGQSAAGKVPSFVSGAARDAGVPAALVAGRIASDADVSAFAASASLTGLAGSPQASLAEPARWLRAAGTALAESSALTR